MNLVHLAWSYLRARPLGTLLNVLLLALGVGTIGFVFLVDRQIGERLDRDARGIDLVVGAKGSPLQLILAGIFHLDAPTGNIPLEAARTLEANPLVREVIPLSLGDTLRGFRIVGTIPAYVGLYGGELESGRVFGATLEAVLGSSVARTTRLGVGDRFAGSHGLAEGGAEHADAYVVVGILKPTGTVLDRLVLVSTESVWHVHEGHAAGNAAAEHEHRDDDREVTVLLVRYASPIAAASLPRKINAETNLQAASPAYESARLFRMIGVGADVIRAFGGVVLATAALSLFIALYHALNERAYDIAVLRTLGARPAWIAMMLLAEALLLAAVGGALGLLLAHALVAVLAWWLSAQDSLSISASAFSARELWLLGPALLAGLLAAILPGWRAARADISATLARRN
jgi:putative ABC transport system permease protein